MIRLATWRKFVDGHFLEASCFLLAALFLFYQVLFLRYRPYDVDNPWFLSFSYNRYVEHIKTDAFLRVSFPSGMDGTLYFGRVAAILQWIVALAFGWHQRPFAVLSSLLTVLAFGCWMYALRRLGHAPVLILSFITALGLTEAFVASANRFRFEPLSFFLHALGILLATADAPFLAVAVSSLSVAVEPAAVLGIFPVIFLLGHRRKWSRHLLVRVAAALTVAAAGTLWLQPELLHLGAVIRAAQTGPVKIREGIVEYFVMPRHLPETIFISLSCWGLLLTGRRLSREDAWIAWSTLAVYMCALLLPHSNVVYAIFIYPCILLLTLRLFRTDTALAMIAAGFLFYGCTQAAIAAWANRGQGYGTQDFARIEDMIDRGEKDLHLSDDAVQILGEYSLWFAHPHHYSALSPWTGSFPLSTDLVLCYDERPPGLSRAQMLTCRDVRKQRSNLTLLSSITLHRNRIRLFTPHVLGGVTPLSAANTEAVDR